MPKQIKSSEPSKPKNVRPGLSLEARENQIIAAAYDLAEKQIMEGTASSQVITHFLKMGSTKERVEKEILEKQAKMMDAKTKSIESESRNAEFYDKVLSAIRNYQGQGDPDEYDN